MTKRERALRVLRYEEYDRLPIVHFGYWRETLAKWADEGHIPKSIAHAWSDGNEADRALDDILGWDHDWNTVFFGAAGLRPGFERKVIETFDDGSQSVLSGEGAILLEKPGTQGIPAEIGHTLKGRTEWEAEYKHRLQYSVERVDNITVPVNGKMTPIHDAMDYLTLGEKREHPLFFFCGSLIGHIRNYFGLEQFAYVQMDIDGDGLFAETVETVGTLIYETVKEVIARGAKFDALHFWEDISANNGPLIMPNIMREVVVPHYKRITDLVRNAGVEFVSVDSDGVLYPIAPCFLDGGVNVLFPLEVGNWNGNVVDLRKTVGERGKELRVVGGMKKYAFALDTDAIDEEIARLKPYVAEGGFIPCPDHRIAPDAKFENVAYYCARMREVFA